MKTNHTKGEWIAVGNTSLYSMIYSKSGVCIAEVKSYDTKKPFNNPTIKQREANAKLIATSPELLEMCIKCLKHLEISNIGKSLQFDLKNVIKKATE